MATIMYPSLTKSQSMRSKRKSAVELLAESKAYYVKSETVRDSQQVLPLRIGPCMHNAYATIRAKPSVACIPMTTTVGGWRPISMPQSYYNIDMAVSPSRSLPPLRVSNGRRSTSACSDVLQNKLRKLLNTDSRENISISNNTECIVDDFTPISPPAEYAITERSSYRYGHQASPEHRVVHKSLPDLHTQPSSGTRESCSNRSASNKSLSNRDSGESSGHYTHRSEPAPCSEPPRPEIRRDSGSSTQHSGASIYCCTGDCDQHHTYRTTRHGYPPPQEYARPYEYANTPYQDPTLSPGPGTFKRQKCFRYKHRERDRSVESSRPILRSKSDISDRYWRGAPVRKGPVGAEHSAPVSHLEQFFEQLGLNSDSYESMLAESCNSESPVFFSDVSTVDSSRPLDNPEYCAAPFRPSEPPSIVERNARIIKWLCNCRKLQVSNT